ncbi:DUF4411 family protein [Nonomuraea sp. MG754425]|uniref:DUF4411 family protein n=1 Tax=Nonomuraea sp. MG754425 TaxID=2570319 RepID=UPI001F19C2E0|nr:DUF4411 family protein [Nonomuraea sp. MG754425]
MDTSALIDGLERYYPEENFPGLWIKIEELVDSGRFFCSEEVWQEARVYAAPVHDWCDRVGFSPLVVPTDLMIVQETQVILGNHPLLTKSMKNKNRADPFVIALAKLKGAIVVTGEGSDGTATRPKIPYICDLLNIRCVKLLDIIKMEHWRFGAL